MSSSTPDPRRRDGDLPEVPAAEPAPAEPTAPEVPAGEPAAEPSAAEPAAAEPAADTEPVYRVADVVDPATVRRAPLFGRFVMAGIVVGAVVAMALAVLSPGDHLARTDLFWLLFLALGTVGALAGLGAAVYLDRRSWQRREAHWPLQKPASPTPTAPTPTDAPAGTASGSSVSHDAGGTPEDPPAEQRPTP